MEFKFTTKIEKIIYKSATNNWMTLLVGNTLEDKSIFKDTTIVVTGNFDSVYPEATIEITGELFNHPKYGSQISCKNYQIILEKNDKHAVINWMTHSTIVGISTQNAIKIYKKFGENTIDIILNYTDKIIEINGIGQKTLEKVKSSIKHYKRMEELIKYCLDLGFTYNIINKLDTALGENALEILKENIYKVLDYADTITFKQLDIVALNNGVLYNDINRLKYGLFYVLKHRVVFEGSTGCDMQFLKNDFDKELGVRDVKLFYSALNNLEVEGSIILEGSNVFVKYLYNMEKNIADKIKGMLVNNTPAKVQESIVENEIKNFDFQLNTQQIEAIKNSLKNNVSIITGAAGCVDKETEFLTPRGWKKIKDYVATDTVAVYDQKTREMRFEYPEEFHEYEATTWYEFKNIMSLSQKLSGEHRVPYITTSGNLRVKSMEEVYETSKKRVCFQGRLMTSFKTSSSCSFNYSDSYLKLLFAVLLEGNAVNSKVFGKRHLINCKLKGRTEEEQIKIEDLLDDNKIKYTKKNIMNYRTYKLTIEYSFDLIKRYESFPESFYELNSTQLKILHEEVKFWGQNCRKRILYSAATKEAADLVQYISTVNGYRSNIKQEMGRYLVYQSRMHLVGLRKNAGDRGYRVSVKKYEPDIGELKYCFTTSTGFWVMRRDDRIVITGNSGKSTITKLLVNILEKDYDTVLLSPTGKACRRLEECTGRYASTIHKYLINLEKKGINKLPPNTVIIIDEISMVGVDIFNQLLDYFVESTRLILVGDPSQLPSVTPGRLVEDLMTCDDLSVNTLTDVMRQSKHSNIIKYCNRVNQGKSIEEGNFEDLYFESFDSRDELLDKFYKMYDKEILENGIDNIQVIMPYKKGDIGVNKINNYIKDNYNENKLDERYGYKLDSKVMHIVNNYTKGIFNGEVGKVTVIDNEEDYLEVTYDTGKITYDIKDIDEIMLAYAITTHKSQGSEYPVVFVLLDDSNPLLLYRRLLYTALSRPKKKLILLSMNDAVGSAIENGYFKPRVTMLSKFLNNWKF